MKEQSMEGINQIGRLGLFITVIASTAAWIFMVLSIAAAVIIHGVPQSVGQVNMSSKMTVTMDLTEANLENAAVKTIQDTLNSGAESGQATITIGNLVYSLVSYTENDNGGQGDFETQERSFTVNELYKAVIMISFILLATVIVLLFNGFFVNSMRKAKSPFDEKLVHDGTVFSYVLVGWSLVVSGLWANLKGFFTVNSSIDLAGLVIIVISIIMFFVIRLYRLAADYQK